MPEWWEQPYTPPGQSAQTSKQKSFQTGKVKGPIAGANIGSTGAGRDDLSSWDNIAHRNSAVGTYNTNTPGLSSFETGAFGIAPRFSGPGYWGIPPSPGQGEENIWNLNVGEGSGYNPFSPGGQGFFFDDGTQGQTTQGMSMYDPNMQPGGGHPFPGGPMPTGDPTRIGRGWLSRVLWDPYSIPDSALRSGLQGSELAFQRASNQNRSNVLGSGAAQGGVAQGMTGNVNAAAAQNKAEQLRNWEQARMQIGDSRLKSMYFPYLNAYNQAYAIASGVPPQNAASSGEDWMQMLMLLGGMFTGGGGG